VIGSNYASAVEAAPDLDTSRGATEWIARGVGEGKDVMSRTEVESDIRKTLGLVPEFLTEIPDTMIEAEWASFKEFELAETAIPNKYKELIGLAVSGATRCRYCVYFHTEAAKLFGATDEEVNEAALMAKHTMGWSTYLNTRQFDYDRFKAEFDRIAAHVRSQEPSLV
jgi:AhpD family alkylhydroperoxidase